MTKGKMTEDRDRDQYRKPESAKDALINTANLYAELAENLQIDLKSANAMEEVLNLAERATLDVLALLPLSPVYCPFCSIYTGRDGCRDCKYAASYGICSEAGSIYDQVLEAHYGLVGAIESFPDQAKKITLPKAITPSENISKPKAATPPNAIEDAKDVLFISASNLAKMAEIFRSKIQKASLPEDIMTIKKAFMAELVGDLPLEKVCSHCGLEHFDITKAKEEALLGLDRYWAAA